jgi:hypothetical protein
MNKFKVTLKIDYKNPKSKSRNYEDYTTSIILPAGNLSTSLSNREDYNFHLIKRLKLNAKDALTLEIDAPKSLAGQIFLNTSESLWETPIQNKAVKRYATRLRLVESYTLKPRHEDIIQIADLALVLKLSNRKEFREILSVLVEVA